MGSRCASPAAPASRAGDNSGADLRPKAGLVGLGRTTVCGPRLDEVWAPKGFCSGGGGADDEGTAVCRGHGNGCRRTAAAGGPVGGAPGGSLFDGGVWPRATAAASAGSTAAAAMTAAAFELQSLPSSTVAVGQTAAAAG